MYFYEVNVSELRYQKVAPLTYHSSEEFKPGDIVTVPYGSRDIYGFVLKRVKEPKFATKLVSKAHKPLSLPNDLVTLHGWLAKFYPYGNGPTTKLMLPNVGSHRDTSDEEQAITPSKSITLTNEQYSIIDKIKKSNKNSFLLHGQTGSGKTIIYRELAEDFIKNHQSVIVLVPEISLISQTESVFSEKFGSLVKVIHSELTKKQHSMTWLNMINTDKPQIVIGTRSAIFAPVKNIGLIIVDEMHEPAYKQDSAPRYNTLRVAAKRSQINKAKIIYGSATPSISEYYMAEKTDTPILEITTTAKPKTEAKKQIIDLRDKKQFSRHPYISDVLISAIERRLQSKHQSLIFLNRRGTARQILCSDCGWQLVCPKCDLPLTLHADTHTARCHTCGYSQRPAYSCPDCNNSNITYQSLGTKSLVEILTNIFPEATIKRFDTDSTSSEKLSKNYLSVRNGDIDILVGTQMLGKGLDLPKLSLLGMINADTSLSMPDFSSDERNYQIIHQAIGRVDRGHLDSEVVIQTFQPDNPIIKAAINQDWKSLYKIELPEREKFRFPPFCFILKISAARKTGAKAEEYLNKIKIDILKMNLKIQISDPLPSFYEKSHNKYNWHIIIRAKTRSDLTDIMSQLTQGNHTYDIDPINLL